MKMIKNVMMVMMVGVGSLVLTGCGDRVEVPPAHIGKIMTQNGYKEGIIPTSKFRLDPCLAYCDRLVTLDISDVSYQEPMQIFIPKDKLNLNVTIKATLSLNPNRTEELFSRVSPTEESGYLSKIDSRSVYQRYASQVIQAETRAFLSQYSINEIASSNEKINADIAKRLSDVLSKRTPFEVRYIGLTDIKYPDIIVKAQEGAAERREAIQQEEAQLRISEVKLERQLKEARLTRAIEKEKAETEAMAQRTLADSVDPRVLKLRELEIAKIQAERWDGKLPTMMLGGNGQVPQMLMQVPNK